MRMCVIAFAVAAAEERGLVLPPCLESRKSLRSALPWSYMMRALPFLLIFWIAMSAPAPAVAQRFGGHYPVCLQKWEWGGSSSILCRYSSWDECRATASGLSAMCVANPYVPQPPSAQRPPPPDRGLRFQ